MVGTLVLLLACSGAFAAAKPPRPGRTRYLLLDKRIVAETENARLEGNAASKHAANPLFVEDKPWEPRYDNLYANIIYDSDEKLYKCWYSPFIVDKGSSDVPREKRATTRYRPRGREMGICYATSKDGLKWEKPELGLIEFEGNKRNNLVLRGPHGAGVLKDMHDPDPSRRYKAFYQGMNVRFSRDGLTWDKAIRCREIGARGDTHNNAFWAPELNTYVGITRLWKGQRIVGRTESKDFKKWTQAVDVFHGDRGNQTYAMPVFRHGGVYLGLVMILRTREDRVHCALAWSPDTVKWEWVDEGRPLLANAETKGDYDWGCAYAAACPVFLQDEIRIYYGGSNGTHGGFRDGCLALATLRPDGFAGFEPADAGKRAVVVAGPIPWPGTGLRISADAEGGSVDVKVLDTTGKELAAGERVSGNVTDKAVRFANKNGLAGQDGKSVRLRFEFTRAKLYSFSFQE